MSDMSIKIIHGNSCLRDRGFSLVVRLIQQIWLSRHIVCE